MINSKLVRTRLSVVIETQFKGLPAEAKHAMGAPNGRAGVCGDDVSWQLVVCAARRLADGDKFDLDAALDYAANTVRAFKRFRRNVDLRKENFDKVVMLIHRYLYRTDRTYRLEHTKYNIYSQLQGEHKFYMGADLQPCAPLISPKFHSLFPAAVPALSGEEFTASMSTIHDSASYPTSYGVPLVWTEIELIPVTRPAAREQLVCCLAQIGHHEFKVIAQYIHKTAGDANDPARRPLSGHAKLSELDANSNVKAELQLKMVLGCKDIDFIFRPHAGLSNGG